MGASYTTKDGYTLTVHQTTTYVDYGLSIEKEGKELFYNPCCLSADSYGSSPSDAYDDYEAAEQAAAKGASDAFVLWTEDDWLGCLKAEAWELIDAFIEEVEPSELELLAELAEDT